jgi:hypothetical protein
LVTYTAKLTTGKNEYQAPESKTARPSGTPRPANTPKRTCAEPEVVETEEFLAMLRFERRDELQELMVET